ncbi:MAG: hypothetical protein QM802_07390 [Agriterribacter sp.]
MKKETLLITVQAQEISFYKALIDVCERCAALPIISDQTAPSTSITVSENNSLQKLSNLNNQINYTFFNNTNL